MVARMVHIQKHQRLTRNIIQPTHFNQNQGIYKNQEVYPMGHITQINIYPRD